MQPSLGKNAPVSIFKLCFKPVTPSDTHNSDTRYSEIFISIPKLYGNSFNTGNLSP